MKKYVKWLVVVMLFSVVFLPTCVRMYLKTSSDYEPPVGDIRSVISAQWTYQSANGGFFDSIGCLQRPENCLSDHEGPYFLNPETTWVGPRGGYVREFHPGTPADPASIGKVHASASSITGFAYVARPAEPEGIERLLRRLLLLPMTDGRTYCGDATGRICFTVDASEMVVAGGLCPDSCTDLM